MYQTRHDVIQKLLHDGTATTSSSNSGSHEHNSMVRQKQWNDSRQFVQDNLQEVYEKLPNLEKQIWGKLIVMEGNRRTAKAYLRHPVITVDGSDTEFDGMRIGISRFENVSRSSVVYEIFNEILQGIKIKIDPDGNIWAKRMSYSPVFLKPLYRNRPNDLFVIDQRPVKIFDIKRFKEILVYELRQPVPDRHKLEKCCLVCLKFSVDHYDLLKTPCWIIIVHLVAIELLNLVLPKDYELSSPSSSFVAAPGHRVTESTNVLNVSSSPDGSHLTSSFDRSVSRSGRPSTRPSHDPPPPPVKSAGPNSFNGAQEHKGFVKSAGSVFRRIIRREEEQRGPYRQDLPQVTQQAEPFRSRFDPRQSSERIYSSMGDLRQSSSNLHSGGNRGGPNWFFGPSRFEQSSGPLPSRNGPQYKVQSMDNLNQAGVIKDYRYFSQTPRGLQMSSQEFEARHFGVKDLDQQLKARRWRSQDSGIGSGGSFGSK